MDILLTTDKPFKGGSPSGNKFLEQINSKGYYSYYPNESWTPNVNLYETETTYLVCVDLAGVDKKKIGIEVHDGRLSIRGHRLVPSCPETGGGDFQAARVRIHLMEIDYGDFARDVELPNDVERTSIAARHNNGMLWIELPKKM
jgi:HSP20 family protein